MYSAKTSYGLEIEVQGLGPSGVRPLEGAFVFSVHNDGSLRGQTWRAGDLAIIPQTAPSGEPLVCVGMSPGERIGLELVTEPYAYDRMIDHAVLIAKVFSHVPQSPRSSVHVHVDVGNESWTYIRNVLLWARALEAPLYRLSCGGMTHRGERSYNGTYNDHMYARPLSSPISITWGRTLKPLIDWKALTSARSATEFVAAWGRMDIYWSGGLPHYTPHRLHALNLASVLRQGTLEWRLFDAIYEQIPLFLGIVHSVHSLASIGGPPDTLDMAIGRPYDVDADDISNILDLDISSLWGKSWPKGCEEALRRSHYSDAPVLPTLNMESIRVISCDDGTDTASLYIRRS